MVFPSTGNVNQSQALCMFSEQQNKNNRREECNQIYPCEFTEKPFLFLSLVFVVEAASNNHQLCIGCTIHQPVRVIDAPRPVAG